MTTANQQLLNGVETNRPILNDKIIKGIEEYKNYLEGLKDERFEEKPNETEEYAIKRAEGIYDRLDEIINRNELSNKKALETIELLKKMIKLFNGIVNNTTVEKEKLAIRNDELIDIIINLERRKTNKLTDQNPKRKNALRGAFADKEEELNEHKIQTKETPQKQVIKPIPKPSVNNLDDNEIKQGLTKYFGNFGYNLTSALFRPKKVGYVENETEEVGKKSIGLKVKTVSPKKSYGDNPEEKTQGKTFVEKKVKKEVKRSTRPKEFSDNLIFIKNIAYTVKDEDLKEMFKPFNVVSAKVVTYTFRGNLRSKGYGFVEVKSAEDQKAAVEKLNGSTQNGRVINVSKALKKQED